MSQPVELGHEWDRSAQQIAEYASQWMDPVREDQELTRFGVYPQPSRGAGAEGSLQLYLPPHYDETDDTFPVLYWLHGGFGNARDGADAVRLIDAGIRAGAMPPAIVVVPHVLPTGWYVDSLDGERPLEQIVVRDLVSHIDRSYRTIPRPDARWIEGMSMGGYGALRLGLKHPDVFGRVSAVAPALLRDMTLEAPERVQNTFFRDEAYFAAVSPWSQAVANAPRLRDGVRIRILGGADDLRLVETIRAFSAHLEAYGIAHEAAEVDGADHDYGDILGGLGDPLRFWR